MENIFNRLFFLSRYKKILIIFILDFTISSLSLWISFSIRLEKLYDPYEISKILFILFFLAFVVIQYFSKSYLKFSRNFSILSINILIRNFTILFLIVYLIKLVLSKEIFLPGSVVLIYCATFFLLSLFKNSIIYNLYYYIRDKLENSSTRILFYGFNNQTFKFYENLNNTKLIISGIYEEEEKLKNYFDFKKTIIKKEELFSFIVENKITEIIISKKNSYENKIKYYKKFLDLNVRVLFLNEIYIENKLRVNDNFFQPKIDDILNFKKNNNKFLKKSKNLLNKNILIIGGAGSIGSQLVESCSKHNPKKIIIVDKDEYEVFNNTKKFKNQRKVIVKLLDAKYKNYLEKIFKLYKPDIVLNAAAYKHVNIVEKNVSFSIYNNIKVALNVCELSKKYKTKINLLVSTDKAVNPKNLMCMSKNICEKIYLSYSKKNKSQKNLIVRFGNVAGSKGSVLPYFQKLINARQPLPVTHQKATRYLMSIKEASELIIKASDIGINSKIYILDMGKPKNIFTLAKVMVRMNGLTIKNNKFLRGDIKINVVGLEKGEKLHEKLGYNLKSLKSVYDKILLCDGDFKNKSLINNVNNLLNNLRNWDEKRIRQEVKRLTVKQNYFG